MALTLDQAIQRLKENEERLRQFVNDPLATGTYSTEAAQLVETLPAFLARIEADIDAYAASFKASYLGPLAADPTLDGNGNPITAGDVYFNTGSLKLRVYTGTVWQDIFATANQVTFTPAGNIAATQVQAAIEELDAEKAGLALNNTFSGANTFNGDSNFSGQLTREKTFDSGTTIVTRNNSNSANAFTQFRAEIGGTACVLTAVPSGHTAALLDYAGTGSLESSIGGGLALTAVGGGIDFRTGGRLFGNRRMVIGSIGNVAPNSKLEVTGQAAASAGSAAAPAFAIAGDLDTGVFSPVANSVSLSAGGLERLRAPSNAALQAPVASTVGTSYNALYPGYMARAWVNFNGTGTVAIRASGNVSSITDNGAGDYTVNFTTAMPDTNYGYLSGAMGTNASYFYTQLSGNLTTSCQIIRGVANAFAADDQAEVSVAFIR
jgi:hypothetical protein